MALPDIVEAAAAALEAAGLSPVSRGRLSAVDGREGIVVRVTPSVVRAEYIDGSRDLSATVTAYSSRRGQFDAMRDVEAAAEALWGATLDAGGDPVSLSPDGDGPQETELSESGWHVWQVRARADWTERPSR